MSSSLSGSSPWCEGILATPAPQNPFVSLIPLPLSSPTHVPPLPRQTWFSRTNIMSLPASLVSPPQTPPSWPRRFSQPALTVTPPWPLKTAPAARPRRHTSSASGIRSPAALSTTASPCFDVGNSPKGNIIGYAVDVSHKPCAPRRRLLFACALWIVPRPSPLPRPCVALPPCLPVVPRGSAPPRSGGAEQGSIRMAIHHRRSGGTPPGPPLPALQTSVTLVGKNEFYNRGHLVVPGTHAALGRSFVPDVVACFLGTHPQANCPSQTHTHPRGLQPTGTWGEGGWHEAIGVSLFAFGGAYWPLPLLRIFLHILTLCGVLVVSTEPLDDLSCLTTPGSAVPETGLLPVPLTRCIQMHPPSPRGGLPTPALTCASWCVHLQDHVPDRVF